eukprot:1241349-Rhodomonas_salina.1
MSGTDEGCGVRYQVDPQEMLMLQLDFHCYQVDIAHQTSTRRHHTSTHRPNRTAAHRHQRRNHSGLGMLCGHGPSSAVVGVQFSG